MLKDERALWTEFRSNRSENARSHLIENYLTLVKKIVGTMSVASFQSIDRRDLVSVGCVGLIEAVDNFDPEKGVEFITFAYRRIKGAIWDHLRQHDAVSRTLRTKEKTINAAIDTLRNKLNREPIPEEIALEAGISVDDYYTAIGQLDSLAVLSYNAELGNEHETFISVLEDHHIQSQQDKMELDEILDVLKDKISSLPETERLVIILYYYEKLNLKEIGTVLSVSESRVSQVRASALHRLRRALKSMV